MKKMQKNARLSLPVTLAVLLCLVLLVILPLVRMFASLRAESFSAVFSSAQFLPAVRNSVLLSLLATVIVLVLAYLLSWCTVRTEIRGKRVFGTLFTLPMLIPSISHGMGLIILLGGNGILTRLLRLESSIYGGVGIVIGSVLYAFPVAYLMLSDVLRYQDLSVYEAADVLGMSRGRQFLSLTLPYLKKPLIAAAFSSFSLIVTDYGVPMMVGGKTKTLSLLMYEEVIGRQEFGRGSVYALFLLIPAVVAFFADVLNKERANSTFVNRAEPRRVGRGACVFSYAVCVAVSLLVLLPILSFLVLAFARAYPSNMGFTLQNFADTFARKGGEYLRNSLLIALLTALCGTALAYLAAYLSTRMRSGASRVLHLLILTFMAIPGIVLGLSYVMTFSGTSFYRTIAILVVVNTAHFLSSPYLMAVNSFGKMNKHLESVGATLGVSRVRMIRDVLLPQSLGTVAEMFSYFFVNCMMTISAVSFLSNVKTKPISLLINQFEAQTQYECAAVVSLLILGANILVKILVGAVKARLGKRRATNETADKKAI